MARIDPEFKSTLLRIGWWFDNPGDWVAKFEKPKVMIPAAGTQPTLAQEEKIGIHSDTDSTVGREKLFVDVRDEVGNGPSRFRDQVTRANVRLSDQDGRRSGQNDK